MQGSSINPNSSNTTPSSPPSTPPPKRKLPTPPQKRSISVQTRPVRPVPQVEPVRRDNLEFTPSVKSPTTSSNPTSSVLISSQRASARIEKLEHYSKIPTLDDSKSSDTSNKLPERASSIGEIDKPKQIRQKKDYKPPSLPGASTTLREQSHYGKIPSSQTSKSVQQTRASSPMIPLTPPGNRRSNIAIETPQDEQDATSRFTARLPEKNEEFQPLRYSFFLPLCNFLEW